MGRAERPLEPGAGLVGRFAAELRELRADAGAPSYRLMAARVHYSRSALAQAADGRRLPTLPVVLGFVQACGGDTHRWRQRWLAVRDGLQWEADADPVADSPWPYEAARDGADPDAAGCSPDAVTAHARRIAVTGSRTIVGQVELRYSPSVGAAWCRFAGFKSLDHLAGERSVEIEVQACREPDGAEFSYRSGYVFDCHWSDLVLTGSGPVFARARLYFDGMLAACGETNRLALP